MLQCLVVAVRPLEVAELAELLAFEFDEAQGGIPKYCPALRLDDQTQAVLSTCSSLVTITNERMHIGWPDRQFVQFSHFSVKEFLVSDRLAPSLGDVSQYNIRLRSAHITLTRACLGLLLHSDGNITEKILERSPFADYAAVHWVEHAQFEDVASHVKDGMESLFDADKPHFKTWIGIYNIDLKNSWWYDSEDASPLYYSVLYGFYDMVEHLAITHPEYVNAFGGQYQFPLLAALGQGHVEIAELLLKHDANMDVREANGKTMLLIAISWLGENDFLSNMVEFLLTHGADVNARDDTLTSSLHLAEECIDAEQVVTILLKHGADVNSQDNNGKTPLHRVIEPEKDHYDDEYVSDYVRLLLEHKAEANRRDKDNQTPLLLAMERNRFKTAQILIEHGADVNTEDKSGKTLLHLLLSDNDIDDVDDVFEHALSFLKHGVEVNRRNKDNETPLHLAIRLYWFMPELARILLEHGADANAENNQGMTPFHILSGSGICANEDVLDLALLLLKHGAEVNKQFKGNGTLLHLAIQQDWFKLAAILLEHGADANVENDQGMTPFHTLSGSGNYDNEDVLDLALSLLRHGAEANKQVKRDKILSHLAIRRGWFKLAGILLEDGADANPENNQGITPFHILSSAIYDEDAFLDLTLLLLKHGAEANKRFKGKETLLHLAIRWDWFKLAEILLEHGADANVENNQGMTPLHILSESYIDDENNVYHVLEYVLLLLQHGAEVNRRDKDKETPLHLAIRWGWFELAGILLENGADANAENNQGMTPLHILPKSGIKSEGDVLDHALVLLKRGAEVNKRDQRNRTPLHLAIRKNQFRLAGILLEHGADAIVEDDEGQTPLHILSESDIDNENDGHHVLDHALLLLKHGAVVNRRDKDKETPLHLATRWSWFELAGILLENGADANAENNQGMAPLHILSESGTKYEGNALDHASLLLRHGAEVNKRDKDNRTPLHLALRRNRFRLAGILLEHGADVIAENNRGQTPLHMVSRGTYISEEDGIRIAQLLLEYGADVNAQDNNHLTPLDFASRHGNLEITSLLSRYSNKTSAKVDQDPNPDLLELKDADFHDKPAQSK